MADITIARKMEYYQGYIRLNVSVTNETPYTIMDVNLDFSFDNDLLHIAKHEPESSRFKNGKFILGNIDGSKSKSITVYFDPLMCSKGTDINCNVTYKDYQSKIKISQMDPQEITVICPLMDDVNSLDCNSLNIGVLKSLLDTLPYHDRRISEIRSGFDIVKLASLSRDVVERRAVCHVRSLYTTDAGKCEMWYYGKTKVTKDEIIIKVSFIRADQTLEIFAATRNSEALTGLLAELGREIIDVVESKISSKGKVVNVTIEKSDIVGTNLLDICNIDDTCDVMNVVVSKTRIDSTTFSNSTNNNNNASSKEAESENRQYEEERLKKLKEEEEQRKSLEAIRLKEVEEERLKREREDRLRYESQKAESNLSELNAHAQHLQPPIKKSSNAKIFVAGAVVAIVGIIGLLILIASIGPSSEQQAIDENAKGDDYYDQGDYQSALEAYNNAIELDPEQPTFYYNKGKALDELDEDDAAIDAYDKALALDPEMEDAWNQKGWVLFTKGNEDAAVDAFNKALNLNPDMGTAWGGKAWALFYLGKYDEAIVAFDKLVEIDPKNSNAWEGKGRALYLLDKYYEALGAFDTAVELDPENKVAWAGGGWALYNLGEYDVALNAFNKALSIDPDYSLAQDGVNAISNAQSTNTNYLGSDYVDDSLESYILGGI